MEYEPQKNTISGWMNDTDLLWLFETAKEMESVVEIGSWKGRSTHALLSGCKGTVYAVDHFLGSPDEQNLHTEAKLRDIHADFLQNVGHFKNLQVLKMDSATAVRQFEDKSIDMVFIDGGHTYAEVLADIKRWAPKAKKIICGHDRRNGQVRRAVKEMFGGNFERNGRDGTIWLDTALDVERPAFTEKLLDISLSGGYDLSILIPAKNEEFLGRTIEDLLEKIEGKTEIIAVADGYETEIPKIPEDPRVRVIVNKESMGQRGATNQACRLSEAKYIIKTDAHCAFDKGFDVKLMEDMKGHDDWTMVPIMRNLHAFDWVCPDGHRRYQGPSGPCKEKGCGKPTVKDILWIGKQSPQSVAYCFDEEPHFQYFNEYRKRPGYRKEGEHITESMSLQGSFFMLTREKYWELNISDESLGSWGSQGIEVACKTWLSGGRVVVNHRTWYAHMFRTQGGDFGFPYKNPGRQVDHAKRTARELFFDNKWEKQVRPLSWLIEKFWPIPGWSEEMRQKIKSWPLQNERSAEPAAEVPVSAPEISLAESREEKKPSSSEMEIEAVKQEEPKKEPTIGIIYYTDNEIDEKLLKTCQKQLLSACGGKKIVSVSLKPMDFGQNIVLPLERGYLTMFKQVLTALQTIDTDIVFFCEHDVLYHPSHFDFVPPDRNVWYYNGNYWCLRASDGFAVQFNASPLSGLCLYRDIAIKHYRERVDMVEKEGFSYKIGFEPMTHGRIKWENWYKFEVFASAGPNIDIKHGKNLTRARWSQDLFRRKPTFWVEGNIDTIPGWSGLREKIMEKRE